MPFVSPPEPRRGPLSHSRQLFTKGLGLCKAAAMDKVDLRWPIQSYLRVPACEANRTLSRKRSSALRAKGCSSTSVWVS